MHLSSTLARRGIQTQSVHPWVRPLRKGEALAAKIGALGLPEAMAVLEAQQVAALATISPDNQKAFPGFNLICPLLSGSAPSDARQFLQAAGTYELHYQAKHYRRLIRLLTEFPAELSGRFENNDPRLTSTQALIARLLHAPTDAQQFIRTLARKIAEAATMGVIAQEHGANLLFGKLNARTEEREEWQVTFILDVSDPENFHYQVADSDVALAWSEALFQSDHTAPLPGEFRCALSGRVDTSIGDKMPNPNLPLLGLTYLMSMNADIPCQTRYGQTSTKIFPVGATSAQALTDAVRFITQADRRDKTWAAVPNAYRDKSDLLIAYLEDAPQADLPVVGLFGDTEMDPVTKLAIYEARTADICEALRAAVPQSRDRQLGVLVLSEIDKGRKQASFQARYSVQAIYEGRDRWLAGANNIPDVPVFLPARRGEPAVQIVRHKPSPAEVMYSFKKQWLRNGQNSQNVPGVSIDRIYGLLLDPPRPLEAATLLAHYVGLTWPLLFGFGVAAATRAKLPEAARREALVALATYGILLLRSGRQKEAFMEDRNYLLGQFLRLADLLHRLYCEDVRDGKIPPQLIGNAAMAMAAQRPRRALDMLCGRMPVYLAWAERCSGEKAGLAKWARKELGRVSVLLKDVDLETSMGPTGKAELLLGYLASSKQES